MATTSIIFQHFGLNWAQMQMVQVRVWNLIRETSPQEEWAQTLASAIQRRLGVAPTGYLDPPTQKVISKLFGSSAWMMGSWIELLMFLDKQPPGAARAFARL